MKLFILARNMFDLKVFFANRRLVEGVYTIATTLLVTKMGATLILRLARIIIVKQWGQTLTMGFSATSQSWSSLRLIFNLLSLIHNSG